MFHLLSIPVIEVAIKEITFYISSIVWQEKYLHGTQQNESSVRFLKFTSCVVINYNTLHCNLILKVFEHIILKFVTWIVFQVAGILFRHVRAVKLISAFSAPLCSVLTCILMYFLVFNYFNLHIGLT